MMQWYYSQNGGQAGPIEQTELAAKITSGQVKGSDMVWRDGMGEWVAASQTAEFGSLVAQPASPVQGYAPQADSLQGQPYAVPRSGAQGYVPEIPNYLWQAIVVTVLCCMPFGIPAIVFAAKVDGLKTRGETAQAMEASKQAKKWCIVALASGLTVGILYVLFVVLVMAGGGMQ